MHMRANAMKRKGESKRVDMACDNECSMLFRNWTMMEEGRWGQGRVGGSIENFKNKRIKGNKGGECVCCKQDHGDRFRGSGMKKG